MLGCSSWEPLPSPTPTFREALLWAPFLHSSRLLCSSGASSGSEMLAPVLGWGLQRVINIFPSLSVKYLPLFVNVHQCGD